MITNVLKLKGFEVYESTFQDRRFKFQNRNIINDSFRIVVSNKFTKIKDIKGVKIANEVVFYYKALEDLKPGTYKIDFWANLAGIGRHIIAIEEFIITTDAKEEINDVEKTFKIEFKQEIINFQVRYSLTNMNVSGTNMTAAQVKQMYESNPNTNSFTNTDKSKLANITNFDDTQLKIEIDKKLTNIPGKTLSTNDFSTLEKQKLAGLMNYDDTNIKNQINSKVDKIEGKVLSDNNFSTQEKNKLGSLENFDASEIINEIAKKVDKENGKSLSQENFTIDNKTKLENLENYNDTDIRSGLESKVDKDPAKDLSANDFTDAEKQKLDSLFNYDDTAVKESINNKQDKIEGKGLSDNNYSTADKNKLAGLSNFDPASIQSAVNNKVDKESGKGLSTNDFSTVEKNKLAGLQNFDATSINSTLSNKVDKLSGKSLSDNNFSNSDKSKLDALISATFGIPTLRTGIVKGTAYQALAPSKPAVITITLSSTSAASLSGTTPNSANIVVGSTNIVASGTVISKYSNTLGGTLLVGLNVTNTATQSYTIMLPANYYFAVVNTTGTGVTIESVLDQTVG